MADREDGWLRRVIGVVRRPLRKVDFAKVISRPVRAGVAFCVSGPRPTFDYCTFFVGGLAGRFRCWYSSHRLVASSSWPWIACE